VSRVEVFEEITQRKRFSPWFSFSLTFGAFCSFIQENTPHYHHCIL
jgi:hypothetical protein